MPIARFQMEDGRIARFEVPAGTTPEQAKAMIAKSMAMPTESEKAPDPTEGMSGFDKFAAGAGKAMTDVGRGIGQMVGLVDRQDVAESRKRDAALMNTGAGMAGNFVGGAATMAPLAFVPGANTVLGSALIGAGTGFASPSASTEETAANTILGGSIGGAIPLALRGAQGVKSMAQPFYQSGRDAIVGGALRSAAGNEADQVAARLASAGQLVPGSAPTVAEAAQSPGIAALQRAATATDPLVTNAMAARMAANNDARIAVLQAIADNKEASISARSAATNALYAAANGKTIVLTPELEALMKRPVMQSAVADARSLAANEGRQFSLKGPQPEQAGPLFGPNGPLPPTTIPGAPGSMLGQDAHTMKMALDDIISGNGGGTGLARNAKRAATGTQNDFLSAIEQQVPEYGQARQTFANLSKPVNQAEVAQAILERSTGNIQGNMTPAAFNRALSDRTAASALGRKDSTLADVFTPEQLKALGNVRQDLQNLDFANTAGRGVGSDTVQKLAYSNMLASSGMPSIIRNLAPGQLIGNIVQRGLDAGYGSANRTLSNQLAMAMLDPKEAAKLMAAAGKKGLLSIEDINRATLPVVLQARGLLSPQGSE